jgi:hypothetical protein
MVSPIRLHGSHGTGRIHLLAGNLSGQGGAFSSPRKFAYPRSGSEARHGAKTHIEYEPIFNII